MAAEGLAWRRSSRLAGAFLAGIENAHMKNHRTRRARGNAAPGGGGERGTGVAPVAQGERESTPPTRVEPGRPQAREAGGVSATGGRRGSVHARHTALTRTTAAGHGCGTHRVVAGATHRSAHHGHSLSWAGRGWFGQRCRPTGDPANKKLSARCIDWQQLSRLRTPLNIRLDGVGGSVVSFWKGAHRCGIKQVMRKTRI